MDEDRWDERSAAQIARNEYCVVDENGQESAAKLAAVVATLEARGEKAGAECELPDVPGVPRLCGRVTDVRDLAACVRAVLPVIERDPALHALSFVNPLRLAADELGIAVSPAVARYLRRALRGTVSFARTADPDRVFRGITQVKWVQRRSDHRVASPRGRARGSGDV
jgi:hypothetical protein